MKRANENDKDIWYVYGYDSEGDFVLIKDYEDKLVRPVIGWKTDDKKPTVTTTDIMNHAKVFYEKNDAERLIKWLKNNWVILNDEMVDYDDLKVGYKDKYDNIYDIDTEHCVLVNSDGDEELEESVMTNERDIIQAFDSKNVRIVETKFHDYDVYLAGTNKKLAVISVERGIICVAINGENRQFPITKLDNAVAFVNDIVMSARLKKESLSLSEAKEILIKNGYEIETLDEALEGPATSKQLWTLFKLTRQDYRGKDLSKEEASKMIGDLIAKIKNGENKTEPKAKKSKPVEDDSNSPVKVGEIYHRNWGYSMCINTYFKVLGVKGKNARVVELDKKAVSGSLMQGRVVPIETPRSDAEELLGMIKNDGTLRIKLYGNYETYRKWDGQSDYEDHMD
ncbi:MAG: hypothetical protein J6T10_01730 [Methanobrevibacter sp.]|nr:hypothetical protein [Methanobrevibacter sp.]